MSQLITLPFDSSNRDHILTVCRLHAKLLPHSLLPQMGLFFMSRFYYPCFVKSKVLDVFLYEFNNKIIGFYSVTTRPFEFLEIPKKKYFIRLLWVTLISLIMKPSRIALLLKPSRITSDNRSKVADDLLKLKLEFGPRIGEFVSFGVLPEYRQIVDTRSRKKIPHAIMHNVYEYFRSHGQPCFIGVVIKENINALKFYSKFAVSYSLQPGDPSESVVVVYSVIDYFSKGN